MKKTDQYSPGGKKALKKISESLRSDEAEKIRKDVEADPDPQPEKTPQKDILPLSSFNGLVSGVFFWGFDVWLKKQDFERLTSEEKEDLQGPLDEIERMAAGYVAKYLSPTVCKYAGQLSPFVPLVLEIRLIIASRINQRVKKANQVTT